MVLSNGMIVIVQGVEGNTDRDETDRCMEYSVCGTEILGVPTCV